MELKSIEDWAVEKNLKQMPNVVDVASFGGPTREYQVRATGGRLSDGKYQWEERPGPAPANEDDSDARMIFRINLV